MCIACQFSKMSQMDFDIYQIVCSRERDSWDDEGLDGEMENR